MECLKKESNRDNQISAIPPDDKDISLRIKQAETAFALCDFCKALSSANEILRDLLQGLLTKGRGDQGNSEQSNHFELIIPRVWSREHANYETTVDPTFVSFPVRVILTTQGNHASSCILRERASAIMIQSSYEMWKQRKTQKIDKQLCLDVSFFEKIYRVQNTVHDDNYSVSKLPGLAEYRVPLTLEVAALYLNFCHSIGLHNSSLVASLKVLSELIGLEKNRFDVGDIHGHNKSGDDDVYYSDFYYNNNYEFMRLILIRTIPYIKEVRLVESVVDAIFSLVQQQHHDTTYLSNIFSEEMENNSSKRLVSTVIQQQSLMVMYRNVEAILMSFGDALPINFRDALHDCLLDVKQMVIQCKALSRMHSVTQLQTTIRGENENMERRSALKPLEEKNEQDEALTLFHRVFGPVWDSDDRWMNRGKMIAIGLISYSVWKGRRRVWRGTNVFGRQILLPVHEIVRAIVRPTR